MKKFLSVPVNIFSHADNKAMSRSMCFVFGMTLNTFPSWEFCFSADSAIYCSALSRNIFFWGGSKTFLRHTKLIFKTTHPPVVIWRGATAIHVTGLYIFDEISIVFIP